LCYCASWQELGENWQETWCHGHKMSIVKAIVGPKVSWVLMGFYGVVGKVFIFHPQIIRIYNLKKKVRYVT